MKRRIQFRDPPTQALHEAIQATQQHQTGLSLAPLEHFEAEALLSSVLLVLRGESARMRRIGWIVGGISLGIPAVMVLVLLLFRMPLATAVSIVGALSQYSVMGLVVAVLFGLQVTSRWTQTLKIGVWLAPKLVDPAALPGLIGLYWQSRRRTDTASRATLEAALVRLLSRWDPEGFSLSERDRARLLVLAGRGGEELVIVTLLTLGSAQDARVIPAARHRLAAPESTERVQAAARECLETLGR